MELKWSVAKQSFNSDGAQNASGLALYSIGESHPSDRIGILFERYDLYNDICILAVLSNAEIDKAKRIYKVDVDSVLDELKAKHITVVLHPKKR